MPVFHRKIIISLVLVYLVVSIFFWFWTFLFDGLPDITFESLTELPEKTTITDRENNTLYTFFEEDRSYIKFEETPEYLINAFIASEDQDFREHEGIDKMGIARAMLNNITGLRKD